MNKIGYFLMMALILVTSARCTKTDPSPINLNPNQPRAIDYLCSNSEEVVKRVEFEYGDYGLNSKIARISGGGELQTIFDYNDDGLLVKETQYENLARLEKSYEYNSYDQLINIQFHEMKYNLIGKLTSDTYANTPFEYENGVLAKQWLYNGGYKTFVFDNEVLIEENEYRQNEKLNYSIKYEFTDTLKTRELKTNYTVGESTEIVEFVYNAQSRLTAILKNQSVIEEYIYQHDKLLQKNVFDYGLIIEESVCAENFVCNYIYP